MAGHHVLSVLIFATCIVCYYNSCQCGFVFDDISAIKENRDLRPHTPLKNVFLNDFWGTPMHKEQSHKSYRPLCVLTFRWNYMLHQLEPMGYHLVNMLLHALVCLIYFRMCSLFLPETSSFVSAMLFAVHPIHTEAVTGVVGRAETLSSVYFLAAFLFYTKATKRKKSTGWRYLMLSMLSMATAMLCKEQGITIAGVCTVYELFVAQKLRVSDVQYFVRWAFNGKASLLHHTWTADATRRLGVLTLTTVSLLLVRLQVMGSKLPVFTRFDNPASVAPFPARQLSYNYLLSVNMWLLLFPCELCCDWTMGTIPLLHTLADTRNSATLAVYLGLALLLHQASTTNNRHQATVIIMSLALLILPFLPASNLFFPVGFVVAERVLYMPSMGFCMLVGYGWSVLIEKRLGKLAWLGLAVVLVSHSCKTWLRNQEWESEYTIFMAGLKVNQRNAKLFNNVGHALEVQGRFQEALAYFNKAVSVQQDDIGAHINVGRTYNHLKMFKEAEDAYLRAKSLLPKAKPGESYQARIAPNHLNVFLNLANLIAKNATRLEEADMLYRQAISMRADYTQAYINRGDVLLKLNRTKEAQQVYERALFYDSNNPDIYYNLGVVFLEQGKASQALAYLDKALEFDPEHEQALLNSAILLQELGREELRKVARERLLKLLHKDATNERVHFNLGMLAMDDGDSRDAEHWFRRAIQLKQDFRAALFNLALLLADSHRALEAAPFLNQLVAHHPNHVKGLILLGDILINYLRDLDAAEQCYRRILELEPDNIQGVHNLCVVFVERGHLLEAEACLKRAHRMAPHEDYVLRHLKIVQSRVAKMGRGVPPTQGVPLTQGRNGSQEQMPEFSTQLLPEDCTKENQEGRGGGGGGGGEEEEEKTEEQRRSKETTERDNESDKLQQHETTATTSKVSSTTSNLGPSSTTSKKGDSSSNVGHSSRTTSKEGPSSTISASKLSHSSETTSKLSHSSTTTGSKLSHSSTNPSKLSHNSKSSAANLDKHINNKPSDLAGSLVTQKESQVTPKVSKQPVSQLPVAKQPLPVAKEMVQPRLRKSEAKQPDKQPERSSSSLS